MNLEYDAQVTVWTQGVFDLSSNSLEQLFKLLETVDFASFIFSPDDLTQIRGTEAQTFRENVIFQLGASIARTGSERSFIILPNQIDVHLPSDLSGVSSLTYDSARKDGNLQAALGPACNMIRRMIKELGPIGGAVKSAVNDLIRVEQATNQETQVQVPVDLLRQINERLDRLTANTQSNEVEFKKKTVFLSYRFVEREYINGLKKLLEREYLL